MTKKEFINLGFACVDTGRQKRRGFPEVIFCQNKTEDEIIKIASVLGKDKQAPLLLTRLESNYFKKINKKIKGLKYNNRARLAYRHGLIKKTTKREILILTGGTSDIPVAEEAAITLELMGSKVKKLYDVGVAGVHRIMDKRELLNKASIIIVIAGMEGALASLVSGLVSCPVISVPTSCGYGSSFNGLAALLTMLNSCSPGIAVVNIDNGFGAGYFAGLMDRL